MRKDETIEKYASLLLRFGVALKRGQKLVVELPADQNQLAQKLDSCARKMGAQDVIIFYRDDKADITYMKKHPDLMHQKQKMEERELADALSGNAVSLAFLSPNPALNTELDEVEKNKFSTYRNSLRNIVRRAIRERHIQWCYACVPNQNWARWMFPDFPAEKAEEKLWDIIRKICMLEETDPLSAWIEIYDKLYQHTKFLNEQHFSKIHFYNQKGTDLEVGLNPACIWEGGFEKDDYTSEYNQCNLPSYEICTTTHRLRTNGIVYASKPLYVNGGVIENFYLEFKNGEVVSFGAKTGRDLLEHILNCDEGSRYLGEVAFVEKDTPVAQESIVFFNTLLDENAACHLALGEGFPGNIQGIDPSDIRQVKKSGVNRSMQHIDFMFGTDDLCATGYTQDGIEIPIFKNGKFV